MSVREQVGTEFGTTYLMFVTVESQFDRHGNLWFGAEDNFVRRFTRGVINTRIMLERKFGAREAQIVPALFKKLRQ